MTKEVLSVRLEKISKEHKRLFSSFATTMQFSYPILLMTCFFILLFTKFNFQELKTGFATYRDSVFGGFIMLIFSSIIFMALHELSHVAFAIKYGKYVEKISLNLYLGVLPMCYVKCKGLNTLQTKQKLQVVMAGVITNFMSAIICFTLLSLHAFSKDAESVLKLLFWGNVFSGFSNLIPTSLSDGYFVLSILLGKYDMKMFVFKDLFTKNRKIKIKDAACYFIYLILMLVSFVIIIYSALLWVKDMASDSAPYIQNIAIGLAILYLCFVVCNIIHKILKIRRIYEK